MGFEAVQSRCGRLGAGVALLLLVGAAAGAETPDEALLTLRNVVAEQKARNVGLEGALERLAALEETDVCKAREESQAVLDEVSTLRSATPSSAPTPTEAPAAAPPAPGQ